MKKHLSIILLFALLLSIFSVGYAETVTIGDGTNTNYEPFSSWWGYHRSLGLYTQAQIGQYGQITVLSWYAGNTGTTSIPYVIYLKTTEESSLTAITWDAFTTGATVVKSGSYSFSTSGWHSFTLDTPFPYTGGNLLVGVESNHGGSGASSYPRFRYTSTTGAHQYWRRDGTAPTGTGTVHAYLPNLQMEIGPISDDPVFALSPTGYDFGRKIINTTNSQTFTIRNAGGGTLNVTGINPMTDGPFTVANYSSFPASLTMGQSVNFDIQYNPTSAGNHTATFTITHTDGTTDLVVSGECYDPTIYALPWTEDFTDTTFPPAEWARYEGLFPTDPLVPASSRWTRNNFANVSNPANPSARVNIYGNGSLGTKHWLVTPPISIPAGTYQLDFDLALTTFSGSNTVNPDNQQDDRFIVLIADNPTMVDATILREWNNSGSAFVYNSITTLGESHTIDLSSYAGVRYIGFYGESTSSEGTNGGDNNVYVDNVCVRETPTAPIFSYTPDTMNFGMIQANTSTAYQNVTVTNTGFGYLELPVANVSIIGDDAAMFEFDAGNLPFDLNTNEFNTIPVRYNPTAVGTHTATLRMVYGGTDYDVALSGKAVGENALFESFEDTTFPPSGWSGNWGRSTTYAQDGNASAYKYVSSYGAVVEYVLSTPMLTIESDSRLNFWARCSSSTGIMQVVSSQDRETWTPVGAAITFTAANTWYNFDIDLSELAGANHYLGVKNTTAGSFYMDMFVGPDIAAIAPGIPTLVSPADAATDVALQPTFTWNAPSTGGVADYYTVYCDENNPPTTVLGTTTDPTFTITYDLPYSTTYYWTVTASNANGESEKAPARSFTTVPDPVISTFPWLEEFTGTFPPANWTRYSGAPGTDLSTITYGWHAGNFANVSDPANNSARINIYGTTVKYWLVTPELVIPAGDYQLEFNVALTRYNNSNPVDPAQQQDDRFIVFIADNPAMTGATVLREWNNTGSEHVYNGITTLGEGQIIMLTAHTGSRYIGFYGESTLSGGDCHLFVDNVQVRETPSIPHFSYTPTEIDFGSVMYDTPGAPLNVTVSNTGGGVITLSASDISILGPNAEAFAFGTENLTANLTTGQFVTIPVTVQSTTEGPISATLRMVYDSVNYDVALSANVMPEGLVTIGEGTSYNSNTVSPSVYGGYYKNGREQYIVTAAELTAAGAEPGLLRSVAFNVQNPNTSADLPNFTVWMAPTEATEFVDSNFLTDLTQVFTVDFYTPVAGWNTHTLTTPFYWDGTSNLVIQTSYTLLGGSYVRNASTYYTTTPTYQAMYYRHDSTPWDTIATGTRAYNRPNMMLLVDPNVAVPDIPANTDYSVGTGVTMSPSADLNVVPADASTPEIAALPGLDPAQSVFVGLTGTGIVDLTFTIDEDGTWYVMAICGGVRYQANDWPLIVSGSPQTTVIANVDFGAKAPVYVVATKGDDPTLPVELSSFNAVLTAENFVNLTWISQSETEMLGYRVYRAESNDQSTALLLTPSMIPATNTSTEQRYSLEDREVEIGNTYWYWLESVDYASSHIHGPVTMTVTGELPPVIPTVTTMGNSYPNPFKQANSTTIDVSIKAGDSGTVTIYNILGQVVKTFKVNEGMHKLHWNGKDARGNNCGSGVYFYKLSTPSTNMTKKMVIVK